MLLAKTMKKEDTLWEKGQVLVVYNGDEALEKAKFIDEEYILNFKDCDDVLGFFFDEDGEAFTVDYDDVEELGRKVRIGKSKTESYYKDGETITVYSPEETLEILTLFEFDDSEIKYVMEFTEEFDDSTDEGFFLCENIEKGFILVLKEELQNDFENIKSEKGERKMKFKVGDRVRVRKDLEVGREYGGYTFTEEMGNVRGRIVTIKSVDCIDNDYTIEETDYWYKNEMFEEEVCGVVIEVSVEKALEDHRMTKEELYEALIELNALKPVDPENLVDGQEYYMKWDDGTETGFDGCIGKPKLKDRIFLYESKQLGCNSCYIKTMFGLSKKFYSLENNK